MSTERKPQTSKDKNWKDEKGNPVPYTRTTAFERLTEAKATRLLKRARAIERELAEFKEEVRNTQREVYAAFLKSKGVDLNKAGKGNHTWYNFDRTIKVMVDVQERIEFDDMLITAARERFSAFLADAVRSDVEFVGEMIKDAFETTNGKLDPKRVMGLLRYKTKVKHALFQEAMSLIEESIRRTHSKTYFSVWERQEDGSYQAVKLDFAAI